VAMDLNESSGADDGPLYVSGVGVDCTELNSNDEGED